MNDPAWTTAEMMKFGKEMFNDGLTAGCLLTAILAVMLGLLAYLLLS